MTLKGLPVKYLDNFKYFSSSHVKLSQIYMSLLCKTKSWYLSMWRVNEGNIRSVIVAAIEIDVVRAQFHSTSNSVGAIPHHLTAKTKKLWFSVPL